MPDWRPQESQGLMGPYMTGPGHRPPGPLFAQIFKPGLGPVSELVLFGLDHVGQVDL